MANITNLIKLLELWQNLDEKSTSEFPEVVSGSPANLPPNDPQIAHYLTLERSRANMYARFIRMSEPYINYKNGTDSNYEITRTCVYGQLREDKKNGLL